MSAGPVCVPAQAGTQGGREELLRVGKYLHQQGLLLLPANTCSPEQTRQMLRCSALHIQSQTLWQRQEPCDDQRLWHLFVATIQRVPHTGVRSTSPSPILHTRAEQEGALLETTLALWAGPQDVPPDVTPQGTVALPPPAAPRAGMSPRARTRCAGSSGGFLSLSPAPGQSSPHTWDANPGRQRGGRV